MGDYERPDIIGEQDPIKLGLAINILVHLCDETPWQGKEVVMPAEEYGRFRSAAKTLVDAFLDGAPSYDKVTCQDCPNDQCTLDQLKAQLVATKASSAIEIQILSSKLEAAKRLIGDLNRELDRSGIIEEAYNGAFSILKQATQETIAILDEKINIIDENDTFEPISVEPLTVATDSVSRRFPIPPEVEEPEDNSYGENNVFPLNSPFYRY
jgi:hypothetical protein